MQWLNSAGWRFHRSQPRFADRAAAGRALAARLQAYAGRADVIVLALPRGGVPVGFEVAAALGAPLDVLLVRKLGAPGQAELALGAIAEGGVLVLNEELADELAVTPDSIAPLAAAERRELVRRALIYRGARPPAALRGRTVILVDDGLATGTTMRAAIVSARTRHPARLVVAVPVAATDTAAALRPMVDELVVAEPIEELGAVGLWYVDFAQVGNDEVRSLLEQAAELRGQAERSLGQRGGG